MKTTLKIWCNGYILKTLQRFSFIVLLSLFIPIENLVAQNEKPPVESAEVDVFPVDEYEELTRREKRRRGKLISQGFEPGTERYFSWMLMSKIKNIFRYPVIAREKNLTGKVYVSMIISEKAEITSVSLFKSSGIESLDTEALRMVAEIPDLKSPAMKDGEVVAMKFTVPISFRLTPP